METHNTECFQLLSSFTYQFFSIFFGQNERLQRVGKYIDTVHKLSATLGMDASTIIAKIHPSLDNPFGRSKNISDSILEKLKHTVESLKEEKQKRLEKVMKLVLTERHIYAYIQK